MNESTDNPDDNQSLSLLPTITTTGITDIEVSLFSPSNNYVISKKLSPTTKFLVSYKAIFTEKYVQALKWQIPVIRIDCLYNDSILNKDNKPSVFLSSVNSLLTRSSFSQSNDHLKMFEGVVFSTSGLSNPIYANYVSLLGGTYQSNCTIHLDFLICDDLTSEKSKFCQKFQIPIVKTLDLFSDRYEVFIKKRKFDRKEILKAQNSGGMFYDLVFYIDDRLPQILYNKIKRIILENDGTRFPTVCSSLNFIVTNYSNASNYSEFSDKIIYYQYVFDCENYNGLLYHSFYKIFLKKYNDSHAPSSSLCLTNCNNLLKNKFICIGNDFSGDESIEYSNKIKAMGGKVFFVIDMKTSYLITRKPSKISKQYQIVAPEWIDHCLTSLRPVDPQKYKVGQLASNCQIVFQFTGVDVVRKNEIKKLFSSLSIKYEDVDTFENCTHLVMDRIVSSEKLFSSIASGAWIITSNFIDDFVSLDIKREQIKSFDFSKYEWTEENMAIPSLSSVITKPKYVKIIHAISKWRKKIQSGGSKPYRKWIVKLYCEREKYQGYETLIQAGGGTLTAGCNFTHVFVDKYYRGEVYEEKKYSTDYLFLHLFK